MGKKSDFMKGTAATLRRVLGEADANYVAAGDQANADEERRQQLDQRERAALAAKYPALGKR